MFADVVECLATGARGEQHAKMLGNTESVLQV